MIVINTKEIDQFLAKLAVLHPQGWTNIALPAVRSAGAKAEEIAGEYPEPKREPVSKKYYRQYEPRADEWTAKQRRYFFWALREGIIKWEPKAAYLSKYKAFKHQMGFFNRVEEGDIDIPYRRTAALGDSLTSIPFAGPDRVGFRIGSNRAYAPMVIGSEEEQAPYHRGHWTPLETAITDHIDEIAAVFAAEFRNGLAAYLAA